MSDREALQILRFGRKTELPGENGRGKAVERGAEAAVKERRSEKKLEERAVVLTVE